MVISWNLQSLPGKMAEQEDSKNIASYLVQIPPKTNAMQTHNPTLFCDDRITWMLQEVRLYVNLKSKKVWNKNSCYNQTCL